MSPGEPSVSAVITAHNSAAFIADALASIRGQSRAPDEIVVIDDGSTDRTGAIVKTFDSEIRYAYQSNRGEAAARNRGVAEAQGDIITFLDADDAWPPERIARLIWPLRHENIEIVCGRARAFTESSWMDATIPAGTHPEAYMMSFGCAAIRRDVFAQIGHVDESMRHGVDLDWFFRCREQGVSILTIDDVVLLYRRHEQNMTHDFAAGREGLMRTVKQSLERRRRSGNTALSLPSWENLGRDRR